MINGAGNSRGLRQSVDWYLIGVYLLLVFIGWINIFAATHTSEAGSILDFSARSGKQLIWIGTALILAVVILFVLPPQIWELSALPLYVAVLGLLVLVIFVSSDVKGSHSWFDLGPIRFQPAEISKITTSLLLALVMSQQWFKITRWKDFLYAAVIIGLPMLIIIAESETGSALVYVGFIFVLYREGLSGWWLVAISVAVIIFISTLMAGPYTAAVILISLIAVSNLVNVPSRFKERAIATVAIIILLSVLSPIIDGIHSQIQGHIDYLNMRPWVPEAGDDGTYFWSFLLKVKPIGVLLALSAIIVPYLLHRAYRSKDGFLAITTLVFIAGILMIFSTDYIFEEVLQPHQRGRIEVLLGLKEDLAGVGYNVNQSKIAIGSGGLFGKGFLQGTQTTFGFVPEQSTDFIFCTVGEEWGFVGCFIVIGLYVFLITRLILDAESCRGRFTRIYGYCAASCVFMHLLINVGMTVGIMPVIGIPLPLLSYGGSSLWAFTILIFIFLALYRNEKKYF